MTREQETTQPVEHAPGIYFGLPMEAYRADPALGSSSITQLNVSPITYWRNSWMNPDREEEETDSTELGEAYHTRLLEGPEVFAERYASHLREEDHPTALQGVKALSARCVELGLAKSGTIAELEARILAKDPDALLWTRLVSEHGKKHDGKKLLKAETIAKIEATAAHVANHPDARQALSGGYPEVSIFWEQETESGVTVRCKARLDRLKTRAIVDLKSFTNKGGGSVDRAIASSMTRWGYITQAVHYTQGLEAVQAMFTNGSEWPIRMVPDGFGESISMLLTQPHAFVFVFVESCTFPAIRVRECARMLPGMSEETEYWKAGRRNVARALETYAACMKAFGPHKPWMDVDPIRPFTEEDLFYAL